MDHVSTQMLQFLRCSRDFGQCVSFVGSDPHEYLQAIGKRELGWTQKYGKPCEKGFPYNALVPGVIPPESYSSLLEKYLAIAPFLLPKDPKDPGNRPTIRHPGMLIFQPSF